MQKFLRNPLTFIVFTIFLDALGFAILIPIVPLLLADPNSRFYILPAGASIQSGYILLGLITAIFPLFQLFATSILGQLSDKFGRRKILMITLATNAFSYFLFALGIYLQNIPILFISRAFAGFGSGNISAAQAAIADVTEPKDRAKNFGLIGAAFGLGFIIGPLLGGKLSDPTLASFLNPTVPFLFAGTLSLLNTFSVKTFFKETNKFVNSQPKIEWGKAVTNIYHGFRLPNLRFLFFINFLFFSGFTFFTTFISIYLIKKFGFNQGSIGDFFAFFGLCFAFTQAVATAQFSKYFKEATIIKFAIIGDGICIGLLFFASVWWMLYLIIPFVAFFNGLAFANIGGLISRTADQKIQGEILGINASIQALAQLIPPILSGVIAAIVAPETPLLVAAIIVLIAGVLFNLFYKPPKELAHLKDY